MLQRATTGASGGSGKYQKVTLSASESKTVNLPFEVKTIVYADAVQTATGYSGLWSKNNNYSDHTKMLIAANNMTGLQFYGIGATNSRVQSISADGKTVGLYSNTGTGGTTFWLYGDEE